MNPSFWPKESSSRNIVPVFFLTSVQNQKMSWKIMNALKSKCKAVMTNVCKIQSSMQSHPWGRCCCCMGGGAPLRPPLRLASAETALGPLPPGGPCTGMSATHAECRNTDRCPPPPALSASNPLLFSLSELQAGGNSVVCREFSREQSDEKKR